MDLVHQISRKTNLKSERKKVSKFACVVISTSTLDLEEKFTLEIH